MEGYCYGRFGGQSTPSMKIVGTHLRKAVNNGLDLEARRGMAMASLLAGMAFRNAGLTAVHAIKMAIGAKYHIAHGVASAMLLPYVMEFNATSDLRRFTDVTKLLGESVKGLSQREAAIRSVAAVKALSEDIGIPQHLSSLGVRAEDIPALARDSMKIQRLMSCNPRRITREDLEEIIKKAL